MSLWCCEYLLRRESSDNYILVMFHKQEYYETRVIFIDNASSSDPHFKEIKSEEATRYRDGGTTCIQTERGNIYLPFQGDKLLLPVETDMNDYEYILG